MTYGKGEVSMCGHMLQTADLAAQAGASSSLIVASLLHDIGHFGTDYPMHFNSESHAHMRSASQDCRHEEAGATLLTPFFGSDVIEPIRLHVAAKRYLCATDPEYNVQLSKTTRHTLGLQGGMLNDIEVETFLDLPYSKEAIQLRRWDDSAMAAKKSVPDLEYYMGLLEEALVSNLKR